MHVLSNKEKIDLNKQDILWHGTTVENAIKVFSEGVFKAFTSQRFWDNGLFLKEDHPDYEKSKFMYGWCMSRDINVSKKFGEILFAFKKEKLKNNFKVKPYAWNFCLVKDDAHAKQEREEFILSGGFLDSLHSHEEELFNIKKKIEKNDKEMVKLTNKLYSGMLDEDEEDFYQEKIDRLDEENYVLHNKYDELDFKFHEERKKSHGKEMNLDMAAGFFLRTKDFNSMGAYRNFFDSLVKHEKFLGFID